MNKSLKPQQQLKIQRAILQFEDNLVTAIQNALDKTSYGNLEESQFRNLLDVSNTTESTEVIKNFLRYQVGRDKKWGRGKDSLANQIINDIDNEIKNTAQKIAEDTNFQYCLSLLAIYKLLSNQYLRLLTFHFYILIEQPQTNELANYIWLELIRRYLGYGSRYLVYKNKGQSA